MKEIMISLILFSSSMSAQMMKIEIGLEEINQIEITRVSEVVFEHSNKNRVVIEYSSILDEMIHREKSNSKIIITLNFPKDLDWKKDRKILRAKNKVYIYGDFYRLNSLGLFGVGNVKMMIESSELFLNIKSCGVVNANIITKKLDTKIEASNVNIKGEVGVFTINSIASNCNCYDFRANKTFIFARNSNFNIYTKDSLNLSKFNNSTLNYGGNAKLIVDEKVDLKSSSISKLN